ncbi:MAG: recombination mediator RecR [Gemmatimonadota bacterium]|nr:recombination mediator RecR [Gemmatimonadota bacterium]
MPSSMEKLIKAFSRMPGIGVKTAGRLAYYLLNSPSEEAFNLAESIRQARQRMRFCQVCRNLTEQQECEICSDPRRDRSVICIVEEPSDIRAIESSGSFRGLYHVLGGRLSPLDGVGPEQLHLEMLSKRIEESRGSVSEVIVATNPSVEGDATACYIQRMLGELGIHVSRIACGLPAGGHLEYADSFTISQALQGRRDLDRD